MATPAFAATVPLSRVARTATHYESPSRPLRMSLSRRQLTNGAVAAALAGGFVDVVRVSAVLTETEVAVPDLVRSPDDARVTDRVFFDIKVAGQAKGRVIVGLFGDDAPQSVAVFKKVCAGDLRGKSGRTVGYRYSLGTKVVKGEHIELGRVNQIDSLNQSPGTPQRQQLVVEPPENREVNDIAHAQPGAISVKRGGGAFEFSVSLAADAGLNQTNIVIGKVLEGMDVVQALGQVPTNQKTVRDGFRSVGRAIKDSRATIDVRQPVLFHVLSLVQPPAIMQSSATRAVVLVAKLTSIYILSPFSSSLLNFVLHGAFQIVTGCSSTTRFVSFPSSCSRPCGAYEFNFGLLTV